MANRRVLHVCPYFLPSEGGSERAVHYISKELSELGISCDVLTLNTLACCVPASDRDRDLFKLPHRFLAYRTASLPHREIRSGVEVSRFPYLGWGYSWTDRARVFSPSMIAHFRSVAQRYSLVHFHTIGFLETPYILSRICRRKNISYVVHVHGLHETYENYANLPYLAQVIWRKLLRSYLDNAERILAISSADLGILTGLGVEDDRIDVVPCGIDPNMFSIGIQDNYESKKDKKLFNVLFVGTLYPNKGLEVLVHALATMNKYELKRIRVDIVGDPSKYPHYSEEIKKMIERYSLSRIVRFHGHIAQERLLERYRSADIFVRPSVSESFGIAPLEAMASGIAVVATDVGGTRAFIKNGRTGFLIPPSDPEGLKNAIKELMEDPDLRESIAKSGQKLVLEHFSWSNIAQKVKGIYERIWGRHHY